MREAETLSAHVIAVTGATGYIAGHIVRRLLREGCTVHATARSIELSESNREKLRVLLDLQEEYGKDRLRLFQANLLEKDSFDAALEHCSALIHAASPVVQFPKDPERDLLIPAVEGTRNVFGSALKRATKLRSASASATFRVCMLSSIAAVRSDRDQHINTETDWNTTADIRTPYPLSKRLAEEEAWKIALSVQSVACGLELLCVNPGVVVGELLSPRLASSAKPILDLLTGKFSKNPPLLLQLVAMDDVAEASFRAATCVAFRKPADWHGIDTSDGIQNATLCEIASQNRYILVAESLWMRQVGDHLASLFPDYPVTRGEAPKALVMLMSWLKPRDKVLQYLAMHAGRVVVFSGEAAVRGGLLMDNHQYRDIRIAIEEIAHALINHGLAEVPRDRPTPVRWTWLALGFLLLVVIICRFFQRVLDLADEDY